MTSSRCSDRGSAWPPWMGPPQAAHARCRGPGAAALGRWLAARRRAPALLVRGGCRRGRAGRARAHGVHTAWFARGTVDGPGRPAGGYRIAEAFVVRRCSMVGAVSNAEADLLRRALRAPRVRVVRNGIRELDEPQAPEPRAGRPSVLALGRVDAARRPEETARILRAVADVADVQWVGSVDGPENSPLRRAGIEVTGWLDRPDALGHLRAASVFVNWSAWEGLSIAVLEAMAHDVLVVASDIDANREVLGPDQVRSSPEEAIRLVRAIVEDPELHDRLLAGQRQRRAGFGAQRMVDEWCALYADVAAR